MKALIPFLAFVASISAATLTWDPLPAGSGVVGYDIHYGPNAVTPSTHVAVGNVVTAVVAATGTNYFRVTGRDGAGKNSLPSNQVVWPLAQPTPPPPVVSFSLSWNAVTHAVKYRVYEGSVQISEQTATTYSLAGKTGPKAYKVCGVNAANVPGPMSNIVNLPAPTPTPTPTPAPTPTPTPSPTPAAPVLQLNQT